MDQVEVYQRRAEECLVKALVSREEDHLTQWIRMAMYWFDQADAAAHFYHHPARQDAA
jgi:hypothetical protein